MMMSLLSAVLPLIALLLVGPPQDTIKTHYDAAEAQRRAGNLAEAEAEYTAILAEGYGRLGKIYSVEKDYKKAFEVLESAASYRPDSEEVLTDLAIAYFNTERYEKALEALGKAVSRNPQSAGARHMLGKTYFMSVCWSVESLEESSCALSAAGAPLQALRPSC
jgi:tetratricopeptide (TPR) repeat protein